MVVEQTLGELVFLGFKSVLMILMSLFILYGAYGTVLVALNFSPGIPLNIRDDGDGDFVLHYRGRKRNLWVPTVIIGSIFFLGLSVGSVLIVLGLIATMLGAS